MPLLNNDTEGYITALALPRCEVPFFVHLLAALTGPAALCGLLSGISGSGNGNRHMVSAPVAGNSCLLHSTQL